MSNDSSTGVPRLGVSACVWQNGRFLIVQRGKQPGKGLWSLPGGRVRFGETLRAAAQRELMEETAAQARLDTLIDVVDAIRHNDDGRAVHHFAIVVFGGHFSSGTVQAGDDAAQAEWLTMDEALSRPHTPNLDVILGKAQILFTAD